MKNISMVAKAVGLALVVVASAPVMAAETATATASVTVKNTFELTVTKPLVFGEIRVTADPAGTKLATVTVPADTTQSPEATSDAVASAQILVPGTPGEVTVAGVSPFSYLSIVLPADGVIEVSAASAAPGTPKFTLSDFDAFITSGTNSGRVFSQAVADTPDPATDTLLTADGSGAASFNFGATLTTSALVTTLPYQDGEYSGSFPIQVDY